MTEMERTFRHPYLSRENLSTFTSDLMKVKNGTLDLLTAEANYFNDLAAEHELQAKKINVEI